MDIFTIALAVFVILFVRAVLSWRSMQKGNSQLPDSPSLLTLPFVGNAWKFLFIKSVRDVYVVIHNFLSDERAKDAKFINFWIFNELFVFVKAPEVLEKIVHSPLCVQKDATYTRVFSDWIAGVFLANPPKWGEFRKYLNLAFTPKYLDAVDFETIVNEEGGTLVECLEKKLDNFFDPRKELFHYNYEISIRTHWGYRPHSQTAKDYSFYNMSHTLLRETILRVVNPMYYFDFIYKSTKSYKAILEVHNKCKEYFLPIMKEVRQNIKEQNEKGAVLEGQYVNDIENCLIRNHDEVSDLKLILETTDLLVAGSDTSTGILGQLIFHIATDSKLQTRIASEIEEVMQGDEYLTRKAAANMTYTEMVIKETLRHYTSPGVLRSPTEDFRIDERNVIPKGSTVFLSLYSIHHNPKHWEKPNEFYPEHFTPEAEARRHKYAYLPFVAGSRNCPGKQYSRYVSKACIAHLLRNYTLSTDRKVDFNRQNYLLVLEPLDGFSVKFSKKSK